ncbi:unnamed protein product [Rotaria sp. Silwood1]|nr:unnamed protein product [Rotaria sp. Silwood1]CAF1686399.1 unnamed protein product [Rotaria sp. Silwood1]
MIRNYHRKSGANGKRQSNTTLISIIDQRQNGRLMSMFLNAQRRLSLMSQISLPHGAEYRPQQRLPPNGLESQHNILLRNITTKIGHNPKQFRVKSSKKAKPSQPKLLLDCVASKQPKYDYNIKTFDD